MSIDCICGTGLVGIMSPDGAEDFSDFGNPPLCRTCERNKNQELERKLEASRVAYEEERSRANELATQLRMVRATAPDVWFWQGQGDDDPVSLVCPVVMSADTLREFERRIVEAELCIRQIAALTRVHFPK